MTAALLPGAGTRPLVVGHRGASAVAPENTMAAFRRSWESGVRWLETDVQPSADGVPVLIHDDLLDRTTDGTGAVRDTRALDLAVLDAGSWFGADFSGQRIPELSVLLDAMPDDHRVLLEIKGPHTEDEVLAVLDVCRAGRADDRVLVQSFERDALAAVQRISPGRPVGLLTQVWDEDPIAACRALNAVSYHPNHRLLLGRPNPAAEVDALHAAGIAVGVWTSDDEADWRALTDIGVDAIMTNRPAELLAWQQL